VGLGFWDLGFVDAGVVVYVAGVVWGLLMIDARPLERVTLAVLWPLGPIAFIVTITILIVASALAYPIVGVPLLMAIALLCWKFS